MTGTPPARRPVRITDVAAAAGVSAITVSRALNTPDLLTKPTLRRVLAAVRRLGYVPNLAAGSLSSRRSRMVVAVVPTIASPIYAAPVQAFTDVLSRAGYHVLLGLGSAEDGKVEPLIATLLGRQPDGLLLVGTRYPAAARRRLERIGIPIVEIWGDASPRADLHVGFSHAAVGAAVAAYLADRGHRRFGVVSSDDPRARERLQGFETALRSRGLDLAARRLLSAPSGMVEGRRSLDGLLRELPGGGAVFCSSDLLAAGLVVEAGVRGLSVPRDLAICGFGNLEIGEALEPPLTSVSVDGAEMGRIAAGCLLDRLAGDPAPKRIATPIRIIERRTA